MKSILDEEDEKRDEEDIEVFKINNKAPVIH